jgi:hypothetical protein
VPRHPSFFLKIKITMLDKSLSFSLTGEEGGCTHVSIKPGNNKAFRSLSMIPHSVSPGSAISKAKVCLSMVSQSCVILPPPSLSLPRNVGATLRRKYCNDYALLFLSKISHSENILFLFSAYS